ncbi:MAG: hypothetical protein RR107_01820 [Clostridia bacterium]
MQNNFNDIFQKIQTIQQMTNQTGGQGLNNQQFMQSFLANNPQFQQYQAMMNLTQQGGMASNPLNMANQANTQTAQNSSGNTQNPSANFQNLPNMPQGVDPMTLINLMNMNNMNQNNMRQNAKTAPVKTGAARRKSFGLSPIVSFASRDVIYSLTMFFAK